MVAMMPMTTAVSAKMGIWESLFWYVLACTVVGLLIGKCIGFGMGGDDDEQR
jgi:hypothetical protein